MTSPLNLPSPPDAAPRKSGAAAESVPTVSPLALSLFERYSERYLARHFHSVALSRARRPDLTAARGRPLLIYLNHPSWWDPLICLQIASRLLPERRHYAPIAAEALDSYRFFGRLGFFAVDADTAGGGRRFLEIAGGILEQPDAALWITSSGSFADPRQRPVRMQGGLGHLASRLRRGVLIPLALEYPFWSERKPEALARFGEEVAAEDAGMRPHDWSEVLAAHLEGAQDALAAEAMTRDPALFETLLGGSGDRAAAGGVHGLWRRLRSLAARRRLSG
jgi:hypothetical protein